MRRIAMNPTTSPMKNKRTAARGIGLALIMALGLALIAAAGMTAASPQQSEQAKRSMGLTYDSLDAILKDLANYKFDQGVGPLMRLRAYVQTHKDDPAERKECEAKLLAFLQSNPAPGGVMAACRSLRLIGSAASVPVLGAMLLKPETTDPARYALERIQGDEVDRALLAALGKTRGDLRRGIISTLGNRESSSAVPALRRLAEGGDPETALDAVNALGKIGTAEAVAGLEAFLVKTQGRPKSTAASALMVCAESRLSEGKKAEAAALYDKLLAAGLPVIDRQAAFRGRVTAAERTTRGELILRALSGQDTVLYAPAIASVPEALGGSEIRAVLPFLNKLPEPQQVELVAVLARYPSDLVLPSILKAAESPAPTVRMEALRSIGKVGNASVVEMLAARASGATGDEQALAREILSRLRGTDVDAAILDLLAKEPDPGVKAELIQAAGARRIAAAKPALMAIVRSGAETSLRLRAVRALSDVCSPADLRDLLGLLFTIEDETMREQLQNAVASVALTIPRPLARGDAAENLLAGEKDPRRVVDLLRVLGKIGDDTALPAMRKALADPNKEVVDAAVRGLADWPDISAKDDVLGIAASPGNLTYKVLALRAFVRMVGLEPYRQPEAAAADLAKALSLSTRPEEKKLVLGLLPRFPCEKGLQIAQSLESDPSVAAEAKTATERIRQSLGTK
jgi:HEAT repeat protein